MDPIADMFTKIRNAQVSKKETVTISYSKLKMELAKLLLKTDCIKKVNKRGKKNKKTIELALAYDEKGCGKINHIKRISKPSRRVYLRLNEIKPVKHGYGMLILSTSKGLLNNKEAIKEKVGGEVICKIW